MREAHVSLWSILNSTKVGFLLARFPTIIFSPFIYILSLCSLIKILALYCVPIYSDRLSLIFILIYLNTFPCPGSMHLWIAKHLLCSGNPSRTKIHFFNEGFLIAQNFLAVQSLSHVWLCDPIDCSTPGFPVLNHLLEFAQTHVHWVGDAIQPSHPLLPLSPPVLNLSPHQGLFQWVGCLHQMAKVLELQHQSF